MNNSAAFLWSLVGQNIIYCGKAEILQINKSNALLASDFKNMTAIVCCIFVRPDPEAFHALITLLP